MPEAISYLRENTSYFFIIALGNEDERKIIQTAGIYQSLLIENSLHGWHGQMDFESDPKPYKTTDAHRVKQSLS